ncbi:MAG TPA: peptidylprolyl isomerase [Planctomycetota bacterium]|nr:peptidylprolyl isomerase [Planctomycetota bacterium]
MTFRFGALRALPVLALVLWLSSCDDTPPYNGPGLPAGYQKYQPDPNPIVKLDTDLGTIKIELFEDRCPDTVDNFVELTEQKFYDGNSFSRVFKDVFIVAGAKNPDGTGGPGYTFRDEIGDDNKNDQYAVGMINEGKPNSNGSQFYIVTAPKGAHWLDKKNTVFGKVTDSDGKAVVDKINLSPLKDKIDPSTQKPIAGTPGDIPVNPIKIAKAEVVSKRDRTYKLDEKSKVKDQPPPPPTTPHTITLPPGNYTPEKIKEIQKNPPPPNVPPATKNELPKKSGEAPKTGSEPPKAGEKPKQPEAPAQPDQSKKEDKPAPK